jgi:hypothetical protein
MDWFCKRAKSVLFAVALGALFFSSRASAQTQSSSAPDTPKPQEASTDDGWHAFITPYIWFASERGTAGALGHEASVDASFGDIFNYLNIGAMGTVEVRHDRVLMPVDFLWMRLSDNKALPLNNPEAESIKATLSEFFVTPKIGYRVADGKRVKVDALFGARVWHLGTTLKLQPVQLANGFSQSATWADAVAGGRITFALSRKAFVIVAGDAGGGDARSDYQIAGLLGYQISRRWNLLGGYRYLGIDYRPYGNKQFILDMNVPGVMVGATFTIK